MIKDIIATFKNRFLSRAESDVENSTYLQKKSETPLWANIARVALIIGILGSIAEVLNFIDIIPNKYVPSSNTVTVLVHSTKGKYDCVLPNRGEVYLIYGDAITHEQINNKCVATFRQVSDVFFSPGNNVEIQFKDPEGEPYRVLYPDSPYQLTQGQYIGLEVVLEGIEQISGIVKDFDTGKPIDSVTVRVFGNDTLTNQHGEFILNVVKEQQKQFVTVRAYKKGYQDWEMNNFPTTTNQNFVIPLKKLK